MYINVVFLVFFIGGVNGISDYLWQINFPPWKSLKKIHFCFRYEMLVMWAIPW